MELIWDGKYDAAGKKIAPLKISLPFQTVETVNESAADRNRNLDLFAAGNETEWRNRLIWGDKKYVLPALLEEFAGKVNLIYIDPPFDTGADFSFTTTIPDSDTSFVKEPSVIEQKAYRDTWGKGLDSYLKWFYETVVLLRDLLADDGSIYVHLDYHVGHYAKAVLDEVFGLENFRNEIIVKRITKNLQRQFETVQSLPQGHDIILWYSKNSKTRYKAILTANKSVEDKPEGYWKDFWSNADRPTMRYDIHGVTPPAGQWKWSKERAHKAVANYEAFETSGKVSLVEHWLELGEGVEFIRKSKTGKIEHWIEPSDTKFVDTLWMEIPAYQGGVKEYATQKSAVMLERIIRASSKEDDLVLDCFCGSGTTAAVAEKLGRRWITCDLGRFAIHTARKRLLGIEKVRPFVVQNLGKYERQRWQFEEYGDNAETVQKNYREFILKLYRATPLTGSLYLHGVKSGRRVHVGGVDSAVSLGDIKNVIIEYRKTMGTGENAPVSNGIDVLGWDFAFELNETARQQAGLSDIDLRLVKIPREVLEKKAVDAGDIKFYELAALRLEAAVSGKNVTLSLTDFVMQADDVPDDIQRAITSWDQWVDYWAVDWDYRGDAFHNMDQAYRTRKDKSLKKQMTYKYAEPGKYTVVVKVIDILGNDTTKTVAIEIL